MHDRLRAPAQASTARAAGSVDPRARSEEVQPKAGVVRLAGSLAVPDNTGDRVVFAHSSGSSRHSRNRYLADVLNQGGRGTILFDLLTPVIHIFRGCQYLGWSRDFTALPVRAG